MFHQKKGQRRYKYFVVGRDASSLLDWQHFCYVW